MKTIQGDNISDSSEKLLQSSRGGIQYIHDSGEGGEYMQSSTFFLQKVSASHEEQLSL